MEVPCPSETVERSSLYRFAVTCTIIFLSGVLLTSAVIWYYTYREPAASYLENYRMIAHLRSELVYTSIFIYAVTSLFIVAGTAVLSLVYSHRVAGPLYKLGMFVRKTALGDFTGHVTLRRNDVIHPLAEDINKLIDFYRSTIIKLETGAVALESTARVISDASGPLREDDLHKAAAHVRHKAGEIGEILHSFSL
ncbi:MAG: methyl-accepting chemotaxis protein [Nitrospirae bacterium]|nr:methyl-accepting chemotaxis protein [Nitrospirota bacterium]